MKKTAFSQPLLSWFDQHGRKHLPWQQTPNSYQVWVSEIMLQQTQVKTVLAYYTRFMQRFPNIESLASASEDEVLSYWSGLGYYARGRNLRKAAIRVMQEFDGTFPQQLDDVMALPGIGRSTAGAILSLACHQHHAILDGNVKRVLARYFAISGWAGKKAVLDQLWQKAEELTPKKCVANYNQAMMDLGATLCTRRQPECPRCPVQKGCLAHQQGNPQDYPNPKPKKIKPERTTYMLLLQNHQGDILLEKRASTGLWGGLWSLPQFDTLLEHQNWLQSQFGLFIPQPQQWPSFRHTFSHFHLHITPLHVVLNSPNNVVMDADNRVWYNNGQQLGGLAAPISRLLADVFEQTVQEDES
ncbi:MAG: A/G-specific adenine glycosylase [Gammaproteobacteria bacterium]|nr:A/G-specific adenine glycosylase [Gammaproteobacteria bacterium]